MRKVFVRSPYNYSGEAVSRETSLDFSGVTSLALQSAKNDADINVIVKRFGVTYMMPQGIRPPSYQDFDDVFDFQTAMNAVRDAGTRFMALPAVVRREFDNDPQRFLQFASDPKNLDKMREMGLAVPLPKVDNAPAPDVPGNQGAGNDGPKGDGVGESGAGPSDGGKPSKVANRSAGSGGAKS